jgi:hypothetical protein
MKAIIVYCYMHISLFSVVRITRSLVLCVCFVDRCLAFVLSGLFRYTDSDYPFGIFKLFLLCLFALGHHMN